jgi:DNA repair exonuclease SbcCD ATPase subunit
MADDRPDGLDEVTQELYGLDPKDFVAARNDLAKRLRSEKQRALAAEVAKLRRPSPAAWAVNQLAREHRSDLEELVRLGEQLRAAQDEALSGAASVDLRAAGRARREAVSRLAGMAEALLDQRGGGGAAHAGEVAATLEAASLDEDAAAEVLEGRLTEELRPPSGFGVFDVPDVAPPKPRVKPVAAPRPDEVEEAADTEEPEESDRRARQEAETAVADARRRWEERTAQARKAVEAVDRCRQRVADAEADVARLEEQLADAQRRLRAAAHDAEAAEDKASQAEDAVAGAAARLRDADQRLADLGGG